MKDRKEIKDVTSVAIRKWHKKRSAIIAIIVTKPLCFSNGAVLPAVIHS
jgi:hypothetical protein